MFLHYYCFASGPLPVASLSYEDAWMSLPKTWSPLLTLFPGPVSANLPSQFPLLLAEIFPITTMAEHTCLLSLGSLLFQEKLSIELLGITAAVSDHRERIFPTGCFSFQLSGALVVLTFRPCHFTVLWKFIWVRHLASKYHFSCANWVQMSNSLTIDHWNGKIKNFVCLFFLL